MSQQFVRYSAAAGAAQEDQPVLINISSILAHWGLKEGYLVGQSPYSAAKIATTRAMEVLQSEEPGIRVVNLHPGLVKSPMSVKAGTSQYSHDHGKYRNNILLAAQLTFY